ITMQELSEKYEFEELHDLIEAHYQETNSPKAKRILDDFASYSKEFKKIVPVDYAKMLQSISLMEEKGMSREQAEIEAFYANIK
ncbi:MAG: hypothetical protein ACI4W6_07060, partial [Acutalibacteraceae bacterium]